MNLEKIEKMLKDNERFKILIQDKSVNKYFVETLLIILLFSLFAFTFSYSLQNSVGLALPLAVSLTSIMFSISFKNKVRENKDLQRKRNLELAIVNMFFMMLMSNLVDLMAYQQIIMMITSVILFLSTVTIIKKTQDFKKELKEERIKLKPFMGTDQVYKIIERAIKTVQNAEYYESLATVEKKNLSLKMIQKRKDELVKELGFSSVHEYKVNTINNEQEIENI